MTWKRATELTGKFPTPKYGFGLYLKSVGDMIVTFPMSHKEAINIVKAAHQWATDRRCRVRANRIKKFDGTEAVRITLVDKQRIRNYK
jgi:hypothetical protein